MTKEENYILKSIKEKEFKQHIYRYLSINNDLKESITEGYVWFGSPSRFNDPFDCRTRLRFKTDTDYKKYIEKHERNIKNGISSKLQKRQALERIKNYKNPLTLGSKKEEIEVFLQDSLYHSVDSYGICCFTKTNNDVLMWPHYCKSHTGLVLEYDVTKDFNFFYGLMQVIYSKDYPIHYYNSESLVDLGLKALYIKGIDWKYENELRLVKDVQGKIPIKKEAITKVIFGIRTSPKDILEIKDLFMSNDYNVQFCQTTLKKDEYGLDIVDLE